MTSMEPDSVATDQETISIPPTRHHDPGSAREEIKAWEALHREERQESRALHAHVYAAGRVLLGLLFLGMAWEKAWRFRQISYGLATAGYLDAQILVGAAFAVELAGAVLLLVGWKVRPVALGLVGYLLTVTIVVKWDLSQPVNRAFALANVGCVAALLLLAGHGAGSTSLDRYLVHHRT